MSKITTTHTRSIVMFLVIFSFICVSVVYAKGDADFDAPSPSYDAPDGSKGNESYGGGGGKSYDAPDGSKGNESYGGGGGQSGGGNPSAGGNEGNTSGPGGGANSGGGFGSGGNNSPSQRGQVGGDQTPSSPASQARDSMDKAAAAVTSFFGDIVSAAAKTFGPTVSSLVDATRTIMGVLGVPVTPPVSYTNLSEASKLAAQQQKTAITKDEDLNPQTRTNTQVTAPQNIREYVTSVNKAKEIGAKASLSDEHIRALIAADQLGVNIKDISVISALGLASKNAHIADITKTLADMQKDNKNAVNEAANKIGLGIPGCAGGGCTTDQKNAQALQGLAGVKTEVYNEDFTKSLNSLKDIVYTDAYTEYGQSRTEAEKTTNSTQGDSTKSTQPSYNNPSGVDQDYGKEDKPDTISEDALGKLGVVATPAIVEALKENNTIVTFDKDSVVTDDGGNNSPSQRGQVGGPNGTNPAPKSDNKAIEIDYAARTDMMDKIAAMKQQDKALVDVATLLESKVPGLSKKDSFIVASEIARTVAGEVGVKGTVKDAVAVANVIMNRIDLELTQKTKVSIHDILNAFDITAQVPNRTGNLMDKDNQYATADPGTKAYTKGIEALKDALNGKLPDDMPDAVKNATHYYGSTANPAWAAGKVNVTYGVHTFTNADVKTDTVDKAKQAVEAGKVKATSVTYEDDISVINQEVAKMRDALGKNPENVTHVPVEIAVASKPTEEVTNPYAYMFTYDKTTLEETFGKLTQDQRDKIGKNLEALNRAANKLSNTNVPLPDIYWSLGPNRPNKPTSDIVENLQRALADIYGNKYDIVVTSGQEKKGQQFGADRHKTGQAIDFELQENGKPVPYKGNEQVYENLALNMAAKHQAAIGLGKDYMNGTHMHVDTVPVTDLNQKTQDQEWGEKGNKMAKELAEARSTGIYTGPVYNDPEITTASTKNSTENQAQRDALAGIQDSLDKANANAKSKDTQDNNSTDKTAKGKDTQSNNPQNTERSLADRVQDASKVVVETVKSVAEGAKSVAKSVWGGIKDIFGIESREPSTTSNDRSSATTTTQQGTPSQGGPSKQGPTMSQSISVIFDETIDVGTFESESGFIEDDIAQQAYTRIMTIEDVDYEIGILYTNGVAEYLTLSMSSVIAGTQHTVDFYDYEVNGTVDIQYVNDSFTTAQSVLDAGQQRYTLELKMLTEYLDTHR